MDFEQQKTADMQKINRKSSQSICYKSMWLSSCALGGFRDGNTKKGGHNDRL
jgi:hypothetical protein